ncbi:DUF3019 domain-containing protein [Psychrobium sp. 1_MG-2023]|uniref:DUF3019 domain-containing protein n=1 Tax=Psychrobium sp. 1_MG-2023 TaxID=3062624 RepID=UPI000C34A5E1|nr:DUF3019 domain-containing protein [Psychrobium sp. 1_MG-2023]MDP2562556.1 DUF3019 domain-containing protein [Psychrobium sp. 1_MG-2023]PKF54424.1 hypothetical protein CW748_15975 [Alteromonadales bacterium alter-6D02]
MCFSRYLKLLSLASALSVATAHATESDPVLEAVENSSVVTFDALPSKCIALRQGRECFTTIKLKVKLAALGHYCVYQNNVAKPLSCLGDTLDQTLTIEFESSQKVSYSLVNQQSKRVIGVANVDVGWVHKKTSRKRRWRLF